MKPARSSKAWHRQIEVFAAASLVSCNCASPVVEVLNPRATLIPAPISIPPSQEWDGNDGPWSSFTIQIGTPAQSVKVLVSTAATQTWAIAPEGCVSGDPTNCTKLRGGQYNYTASSSWISNTANISTNIYQLGLENSLGYTGNGRYGFDDITLGFPGSGGPTLNNQTIAGVATKSFYMGLFGLTPRPSNFTDYNDPVPSYMENLYNQSKIPSKSWGYTAGNQYRLNEVLGSLTLGGYDSSKFVPNNLTFSFNAVDDRDLTVQIENIYSSDGTSLLPSTIAAFLDSTVPYIYLPVAACTLFENAFGIIWNSTSELYLVNNTQHLLLQTQNPSITFTLGNLTSSTTVNITLPYAAFDLTATAPLVDNSSKYFPLRRADNATQYTLGRAFFQEAYVIADYHRNNFSVSQCKWDGVSQSLVTIYPPTNDTTSSSSSTGLSTGAIAGIAAGGGVILLALAAFIFFVYLPRRRKQKAAELANTEVPRPDVPPSQNTGEIQEYYQKPELDSGVHGGKPYGYGPVYETEGSKVVQTVEMENTERSKEVFEMPALEEVAIESGGRMKSPPMQSPPMQSSRELSTSHNERYRSRSWERGGENLTISTAQPRNSGQRILEENRTGYSGYRPEIESLMVGRSPRSESMIPGGRTPNVDSFGREIRGSMTDTVSSFGSPRSMVASPASASEVISPSSAVDWRAGQAGRFPR